MRPPKPQPTSSTFGVIWNDATLSKDITLLLLLPSSWLEDDDVSNNGWLG